MNVSKLNPFHYARTWRKGFALTTIGLALGLPFFQANAIIGVAYQMQLGNPSSATTDPGNTNHYLIQRTVEALDYNATLREPNWASWDLTAADVGSSGRSASFFTDTNLPPAFYEVTPSDYTGSGFDRGHMCPSDDRTDNSTDNDLVFFMSNIIPQASNNNQGVWADFETYCRTLAQSGNELLITCGPSGFDGSRIPSSGAVAIPEYTWKIAVVVPLGIGTALDRITTATRVIAIKIPNSNSVSAVWQDYVTSANQIQADTGFTFFTALPDNIASALRGKVDGPTNTPVITGFSPTTGAVNTSVTIAGINLGSATSVAFNGASAWFIINSSTQITATVPTNATSGVITVITANGTATSAVSFAVTSAGGGAYTGILAGWDVAGQTGYGVSPLAPSTNALNLTITGLTRGSGVATTGTAAARAWGGAGFTDSAAAGAITANRYATFGISASPGYSVSLSSVGRFDYRRSGTGPASGLLQCQVGSGSFLDLIQLTYSVFTSGGGSLGPIDLSAVAALQNVPPGTPITFRIVNYGATSSGGTWYLFDVANSAAPDLTLVGSLTPLAGLTPIQSWRQQWFGFTNNAGQAADTFVNTADGMPNLLKYALGLNPLIIATNPVVAGLASGYLRLTTPKNPTATDIFIAAVVSSDLTVWTTNGIAVDQDSPTRLDVHDGLPAAAGTNRYIRLRVSDP